MDIDRLKVKLDILADAAKYDVSCSLSGSNRKNKNGLGNGSMSGICHSFTEDGRCVSLLFKNLAWFQMSFSEYDENSCSTFFP